LSCKATEKINGTESQSESNTGSHHGKEISKQEIRREDTSKRAAIEGNNSALKRGQGENKLRIRGMIKCQLQIGLKVIGHNFKQFYRAIHKPKPQTKEVVC